MIARLLARWLCRRRPRSGVVGCGHAVTHPPVTLPITRHWYSQEDGA